MMNGERSPGRYRPTALVIAATASMLISACTDGGGDSATADVVSSSVEGIPRPPGHEGLWYGTEPRLPLDHLVWASQRYIGDPVAVPTVGDRAKGPEARDLPDVCDSQVVGRLVDLGLQAGAEPDAGHRYVQCSVLSDYTHPGLRGIDFLWGAVADADILSGQVSDDVSDANGIYLLETGPIAEEYGCVAIQHPFSDEGAVFTYFGSLADYDECDDVAKIMQVIFNILGGSLVQI
jgi:hypothetical protein